VESWRWLIEEAPPESASSGFWNMGVDEAVFESARRSGRATLRFYGWSGPWLSLGYAQPFDTERRRACVEAGVGVVRRVTGGRAVLHGSDLTYSLAAPEATAPEGLRGAYARIADALVQALREAGVPVERQGGAASAPAKAAFDCFLDPARDELCLGGRKLAGSAQRRVAGAFVQHGSIRLEADPPEALRAAGLAGEGATSLAEAGFPIAPAELTGALARAFARVFGVALERGDLTPEERSRASRRGLEPPGRAGLLYHT